MYHESRSRVGTRDDVQRKHADHIAEQLLEYPGPLIPVTPESLVNAARASFGEAVMTHITLRREDGGDLAVNQTLSAILEGVLPKSCFGDWNEFYDDDGCSGGDYDPSRIPLYRQELTHFMDTVDDMSSSKDLLDEALISAISSCGYIFNERGVSGVQGLEDSSIYLRGILGRLSDRQLGEAQARIIRDLCQEAFTRCNSYNLSSTLQTCEKTVQRIQELKKTDFSGDVKYQRQRAHDVIAPLLNPAAVFTHNDLRRVESLIQLATGYSFASETPPYSSVEGLADRALDHAVASGRPGELDAASRLVDVEPSLEDWQRVTEVGWKKIAAYCYGTHENIYTDPHKRRAFYKDWLQELRHLGDNISLERQQGLVLEALQECADDFGAHNAVARLLLFAGFLEDLQISPKSIEPKLLSKLHSCIHGVQLRPDFYQDANESIAIDRLAAFYEVEPLSREALMQRVQINIDIFGNILPSAYLKQVIDPSIDHESYYEWAGIWSSYTQSVEERLLSGKGFSKEGWEGVKEAFQENYAWAESHGFETARLARIVQRLVVLPALELHGLAADTPLEWSGLICFNDQQTYTAQSLQAYDHRFDIAMSEKSAIGRDEYFIRQIHKMYYQENFSQMVQTMQQMHGSIKEKVANSITHLLLSTLVARCSFIDYSAAPDGGIRQDYLAPLLEVLDILVEQNASPALEASIRGFYAKCLIIGGGSLAERMNIKTYPFNAMRRSIKEGYFSQEPHKYRLFSAASHLGLLVFLWGKELVQEMSRSNNFQAAAYSTLVRGCFSGSLSFRDAIELPGLSRDRFARGCVDFFFDAGRSPDRFNKNKIDKWKELLQDLFAKELDSMLQQDGDSRERATSVFLAGYRLGVNDAHYLEIVRRKKLMQDSDFVLYGLGTLSDTQGQPNADVRKIEQWLSSFKHHGVDLDSVFDDRVQYTALISASFSAGLDNISRIRLLVPKGYAHYPEIALTAYVSKQEAERKEVDIETVCEALRGTEFTPEQALPVLQACSLRTAALLYQHPDAPKGFKQAFQAKIIHGKGILEVLPNLLSLQGPARRKEFCSWAQVLPQLVKDLGFDTKEVPPGRLRAFIDFVKRFGLNYLPKTAAVVIEMHTLAHLKKIAEKDPSSELAQKISLAEVSTLMMDVRKVLELSDTDGMEPMKALNKLSDVLGGIRTAILEDRLLPTHIATSVLGMEAVNAVVPHVGSYQSVHDRGQLIQSVVENQAELIVSPVYERANIPIEALNATFENEKNTAKRIEVTRVEIAKKWQDETMVRFVQQWDRSLQWLEQAPKDAELSYWLSMLRGDLNTICTDLEKKIQVITHPKGKEAAQRDLLMHEAFITRIELLKKQKESETLSDSAMLETIASVFTDKDGRIDRNIAIAKAGNILRAIFLRIMRYRSPQHFDAIHEAREVMNQEANQPLIEAWAKLFKEEYIEHFANDAQNSEVISANGRSIMHALWRTKEHDDAWRLSLEERKKPMNHPFAAIAEIEVLEEGIQKLLRKEYNVTSESMGFYPVKGIGRVLAGDIANACYNKHRADLAKGQYPGITAVLFSLPTRPEIAGSMLLVEGTTLLGDRVLLIRALNPTEAVIQRSVDPTSMVLAAIEYATQCALRSQTIHPMRPIKQVRLCIDHSGGHCSNRQAIYDAERRLAAKHDWRHGEALHPTSETRFNGYGVFRPGETVIVWSAT